MKHDAQDGRYLFVFKSMLFKILTSLFFNLKEHLLGDIIFKVGLLFDLHMTTWNGIILDHVPSSFIFVKERIVALKCKFNLSFFSSSTSIDAQYHKLHMKSYIEFP
jgi:hypothetical protein